MRWSAYVAVTLNNCLTEFLFDNGDEYYKSIAYRDPDSGKFPPLSVEYHYEVEYGKKTLDIEIIGFEKSFLHSQDKANILPDCLFHNTCSFTATDYDEEDDLMFGKYEIDLNNIYEHVKPYEFVTEEARYFDTNVMKIIVAIEGYKIKPTLDCRLTEMEELNYLYIGNGDDYWNTYYYKFSHGNYYIREYDPFRPNENLKAEMEIKIDDHESTLISVDKGISYYKNIVYRDSVTGRFPILYFKCTNYSNTGYHFDTIQLRIIGFKKSMLSGEPETDPLCMFHKIFKYDYYSGPWEMDLNEESSKPHKKANPSDIQVLKLIISVNDYVIKPAIDCQLTRKEELYYRHLYHDDSNPFEADEENPYDSKNWSKKEDQEYWKKYKWTQLERDHNKLYWIREIPTCCIRG